jgi:hypothetical protein
MPLKLLNTDGQEEIKRDPRMGLINKFNEMYLSKTGRKNPVNFGWCMKMMEKQFVTVDEESGECWIEYPELETWLEQVNGFFKDEWARTKSKYHFSYLMKRWGGFAEFSDTTPTQQIDRICPDCGEPVKRINRDAHQFTCEKRKI